MGKIKKQAIPAVRSIKIPKADLIRRETNTHVMAGSGKSVDEAKAEKKAMGDVPMKKRPFKRKNSLMK